VDLYTYAKYDGTGLAELVKKKEVTPKELTETAFKQIENINPLLNGVVRTRQEKVLKELLQLDLQKQPFAGVPMLLKDISQAVEGEPLTAGSKLLKDNISGKDSNFVARLRRAGFLFLGHTNTPEFGLKILQSLKFMDRRRTHGIQSTQQAGRAADQQRAWQQA
jgi:amidase